MRILVVTNLYPPHYIGGYELGCQKMVESLENIGHDMTVLTSTFGVSGEVIQGRVHRKLSIDFHRKAPFFKVVAKESANQRHFLNLCAELQPELVFCWNLANISLSLVCLARDRQIPVSYYMFDNWSASCEIDQWHQQSMALHPLQRRALRLFQPQLRVFSPEEPLGLENAIYASRYLKLVACRAGKGVADAKVLHWGVPAAPAGTRNPGSVQAQQILYVGQIVQLKGVHTVVEAVGILRRSYGSTALSLTLVGDAGFCPEYTQRLRAIIARYDIGELVQFAGKVSPDDLSPYYDSHAVLVFPSTWDEPFGITQLEAMSHGLAVVGSATGGSAEILEDEVNSLVFRREDPDDCARQIARLLEDEALRQRVSLGGIESVRTRFNFEAVVLEMERLLVATVRQGYQEKRCCAVPSGQVAAVSSPDLLRESVVAFHKLLSVLILVGVVQGNKIRRWLRFEKPPEAGSLPDGDILLVALGDAADLVLAAPCINTVPGRFPGRKVRLVVRPELAEFLEGSLGVAPLIPFDFQDVHEWSRMTRGHLRWWCRALSMPRAVPNGPGVAVNLSWRDVETAAAAAVMHGGGARYLLGFRDGGAGVLQRILNNYIDAGPLRQAPGLDTDAAALETLCKGLGVVGATPEAGARKAPPPGGAARSAADFIKNAPGPVIALAPGGQNKLQRWPVDCYVELGNWLQAELGAAVIVLGEPGDSTLCQNLFARLKGDRKAVFAGQLRLHEIYRIMPELSLLCGNDNCFFYASVLFGTAAVGLFGPGVQNRIQLSTRNHQVIRLGLTCSPCSGACLYRTPVCIEGIDVDTVKRAIASKLH